MLTIVLQKNVSHLAAFYPPTHLRQFHNSPPVGSPVLNSSQSLQDNLYIFCQAGL
jgi:hypothetical protein